MKKNWNFLMTVSTDYLELVKKKHGLINQNQLAVFFDVTRQSINHYYSEKRNFDIAMLLKVSKALEIDIEEIALKLCIEQARTEKIKTYWEKEYNNFLSSQQKEDS